MKKTLFQEDDVQSSEINISPLIDIVFILLIFFIVTTTFVEEAGVEITKPQAISAQQLQKESIMIAITDDGRVVYGGRVVGTAGVRPLVDRLLSRGDLPVIVLADRNVRTELLVDVIDEAKLGGATSVNIATRSD
ncbi:MAG: biopolymer transporter ExbD [Gammaproteobacteria bacterium]|jgi:biopolymer transport protein ExbD